MTKEQFIKDLVKYLNKENKNRVYYNKQPLDVCYMVSVIDQNIDKCKDLIKDITKHDYEINDYIEDTSGGYTNGKLNILIKKSKEEKDNDNFCDAYYDYIYEITFTIQYHEENEYRWEVPAFEIRKIINMGNFKWIGQQKDYWIYENQFKENEINQNKELEEYKKRQKIKAIQEQIANLQQELLYLNI